MTQRWGEKQICKKIKAILFDSGRVLNRPVTGHWFITPNFFDFINESKFRAISKKLVDQAFYKANKYISNQKLIQTEDEEFSYFFEFYKIFSKELPELGLTDIEIESITSDLVYNYEKYEFYKDAINLIPVLKNKYKLALVSDAWPSLENVFKQAGLRDCFSSFVISSIIGVSKPHELMYKTALEELNLLPSEVLFVDDNIINCKGAENIGIRSIVLCRDWKLYFYYKLSNKHYSVVTNLENMTKHIKKIEMS